VEGAIVLRPSGVVLDPERRRVVRPEGPLDLTPREAALLGYLTGRPWVVVRREELLRDVWRVRATTRTKALDMCVRRLRERIELDPDDPQHLLTVRGEGYRFVPGPPDTAPAGPGRGGNLPPEGASFVGRQREVERVARLLGEGARLVAVVGPAGVGKSRLAREAGRRIPRPVWVVDLGEERSVDGVLGAIGRVLGVVGGELGPARLAGALAARGPLVLVLDAIEGCVEALGPLVSGWTAPGLQVVATSRRSVALPGAVEVRLDPMSTDELEVLIRDRAARPLDPAVGALAARLEGLPLAAELAAGRLRLYTCAQLIERLERGWDVLRTGSARGGPSRAGADRHASLHDALLATWELLDPGDRDALGELAVFRGGFTLEAARAVLGGEDAEDRVQHLLDHSVLRVEAGEPPRFRLFDSVRELASARLAPARRAEAEQRHAGWFLPPTASWPPRIRPSEEDRAYDTANLAAAIERADDPVRAIAGLARLWHLRHVDLETTRRLADHALARGLPEPEQAIARMIRGESVLFLGRPQDAVADFDAALELARPPRGAVPDRQRRGLPPGVGARPRRGPRGPVVRGDGAAIRRGVRPGPGADGGPGPRARAVPRGRRRPRRAPGAGRARLASGPGRRARRRRADRELHRRRAASPTDHRAPVRGGGADPRGAVGGGPGLGGAAPRRGRARRHDAVRRGGARDPGVRGPRPRPRGRRAGRVRADPRVPRLPAAPRERARRACVDRPRRRRPRAGPRPLPARRGRPRATGPGGRAVAPGRRRSPARRAPAEDRALAERVGELGDPGGRERFEAWVAALGTPSARMVAGIRIARTAARLLAQGQSQAQSAVAPDSSSWRGLPSGS
jgi:DNA-binding winged helix-turn-helix (wHTH) protein/predicted ATPase